MRMPRWSCAGSTTVFLFFVLLPTCSLSSTRSSGSQAQSSYQLRSSAMGAAGNRVKSTSYRSSGTLGQPAPIGVSESAALLYSGFWKSYLFQRLTGTEDIPHIYTDKLFQNYPNPFNPSTTIRYSVSRAGPVSLMIFNVRGQRVRSLVSEERIPGDYKAVWNGLNDRGEMVASGIYFYLLRSVGFRATKKMVLLK